MTRRLRIAGFAGASLIRALGKTWRFRITDEKYMDQGEKLAPASIYAFWHGRILPLVYHYRDRDRPVHVLASIHRDGELTGRTIGFLGFGHVRGSSTRRGARAIREMVALAEAGNDLGLTVDGPVGPRGVVKPGLIEIAKLTGVPIVPVATGSRHHWTFRSWDAFEFPKPFTRVGVWFAPPVLVSADATSEDLEEKRLEVERSLRHITELNDRDLRS